MSGKNSNKYKIIFLKYIKKYKKNNIFISCADLEHPDKPDKQFI